MQTKRVVRQAIITNCHPHNPNFWELYHIFRLTICPGMPYKMFEAYYKSQNLEYIDVSFFYTDKKEVAGFCAAAFYRSAVGGKPVTIGRSATGFLPQHRGGAVSKWKLYSKYMAYKCQHPFRRLILTIYASNPFVYSMVCKYTGIVHPRVGQSVSPSVISLKNEILAGNHLQKRELVPFVVRINFEVEKTKQLKQQASESTNRHVRFFVEKTGLQPCISLLVIVPVSFLNIMMCIGLMLRYYGESKYRRAQKFAKRRLTTTKNKLTCWLNPSAAPYANSKTTL